MTKVLMLVSLFLLFSTSHAEYEGIKAWKEPLLCYPVKYGRLGEPIKLLWSNFLTFDENSRMVFLKIGEGIHTVPSKGFICVPESIDANHYGFEDEDE